MVRELDPQNDLTFLRSSVSGGMKFWLTFFSQTIPCPKISTSRFQVPDFVCNPKVRDFGEGLTEDGFWNENFFGCSPGFVGFAPAIT